MELSGYMPDHLDCVAYFARHSALAMKMPVSPPIHLESHVKKWNAIKGPFVHSKSREVFERITYKRLLQVFDSHPETVEAWVQYVNKLLPCGIDMKVDRWESKPIGFSKELTMDGNVKSHKQKILEQAEVYLKQFTKT